MVPPPPKKHGYGTGTGNGARQRRYRLIKDSIQGITKSSIRKLARRGGVTRIEHTVYTTVRDVLQHKLREILFVAIQYVKHRNTKTVTSLDIVYALRHIPGMAPVYGYSYNTPIAAVSKPKALSEPTHPAPSSLNETPAISPNNDTLNPSKLPSETIKPEPTTMIPEPPSSDQESGLYDFARITAWTIHVSQVGITDRRILEDLSFFNTSSSSSSSDM